MCRNLSKLPGITYPRTTGMQKKQQASTEGICNGRKRINYQAILQHNIIRYKQQRRKNYENAKKMINSSQLISYKIRIQNFRKIFNKLQLQNSISFWKMNRIDNSLFSQSGESRKITIYSSNNSFQGLIQKILKFQKQIISKLELIYDSRYIQKLARPIEKTKKQSLLLELQHKIKYIHDRMQEMENQFDLTQLNSEREPQKLEKVKKKTQLIILGKLSFFNIRKKYTETFVHSSFIFLNKITTMFQLKHTIEFIDGDKWLSNCLQKTQKGWQKQVKFFFCCDC